MKTETFEEKTGARERGLKSEQHCSDQVRGWFVLQGLNVVGLGCSGAVALGHLSQDGSGMQKKRILTGIVGFRVWVVLKRV